MQSPPYSMFWRNSATVEALLCRGRGETDCAVPCEKESIEGFPLGKLAIYILHWLGAYRTNALYSGHIFVRFNDLKDVFT